jgi:hypothetical protein
VIRPEHLSLKPCSVSCGSRRQNGEWSQWLGHESDEPVKDSGTHKLFHWDPGVALYHQAHREGEACLTSKCPQLHHQPRAEAGVAAKAEYCAISRVLAQSFLAEHAIDRRVTAVEVE